MPTRVAATTKLIAFISPTPSYYWLNLLVNKNQAASTPLITQS
jgi:hypothetical protein